ncbi:hypothetical protein SZ66_22940 [Pantoea ananatis]|nr:DUF905 family protein [Pantoea ananatis]MDC7862208.1 hypothetical protein [Pantoea ananatis]
MPDRNGKRLNRDGYHPGARGRVQQALAVQVAPVKHQVTHFQLVIRDAQGGLIWRAWNFEAEAGFGLTTYIREYGVRR